jgi:hypothetical protein
VKYTLVRGMALTLGVCAVSNAAFAQYSIGESGPGLTSGAYAPIYRQDAAPTTIPGTPVGYQSTQTVGSGITPAIPAQVGAAIPAPPQYTVADVTSRMFVDSQSGTASSVQHGSIDSTVASSVSDASCNTASCSPSIQPLRPWIFGANGLLFNRLDSDCTALTYSIANPTYPLLCTSLVDMPTTGGYELYGGRYFGCGRYALIGSYWGVFSPQQHASITEYPGTELMPALFFTYDSPWGGSTAGIRMTSQWVSDWYNQAHTHRVTREQSFQNAEINFVSFALGGGARQPYGADCNSCLFGGGCADDCGPGPTGACAPWYGAQCSRLRLNAFAGLRWFRFQDQLEFGASEADGVFDYSNDDFFYRNEVTNDLFGGQLGTTATWCTGRCVNLFAGTSFGVYNNRMSLSSYAGTANEIATIVSANDFNGQQFSFSAHDNDIALLGEGNVGAGIRISRGWTANIGYRLIGVSGVATSVGQIPRDFGNLNSAWFLKNEHSILLNGMTIGAAYNF